VNQFLGNSSYGRLLAMIGHGKSVLDLGCGPGNLARILSDAGNTVVGVDNDESSLAAASEFCERVVVADLRHDKLAEAVGSTDFDAVVLADVIEHVTNPVALLQKAKGFLRPGGFLYASIPNVAHGAVRLALLRGDFAYTRIGIMDETHVRFYTRASIEELFSESGYRIVEMTRTTAPIFVESDLVPLVRRTDFNESVVAEIEHDPECETLQFIVRAEPVASGEGDGAVHERLSSALQEVRTLEARYAQLERGAAEERAAYARELERLGLENQRLAFELERARFDAGPEQARQLAHLAAELAASAAEREKLLAQLRGEEADLDARHAELQRVAEQDRAAYARELDELRLENKRIELELDRYRFDADASQDREVLRLQAEVAAMAAEREKALERLRQSEEGGRALEAELETTRQRYRDAVAEIGSLKEISKSARIAVGERDALGRRISSLEAALQNTEESLHDLHNACDDARRNVADREVEIRDLMEKLLAVKAAHAVTLGELATSQRRAEAVQRSEGRIVELERALAGREQYVSRMSRSIDEYVTVASAMAEHQERLCAEISHIHHELVTMRASKFWRLRDLWFRLRRGRSG
jgi:2-polyprenyl-3-methyl-5-hydroxy-6-metoxy-1,4-benzoquinol methylase